ncbi:NfeD family protein [Candidatus Tachikawaea gelatinosa]|uniref:NfeD-like C-terminal domain-containing protein n=1 Tax=Candidatus Tachikawaea gelatinosa TaxID=1410383 RepID=A0A090AKA4_9ENTR|nr:NfeD family protein [Candidatus Tachikawaea gelatinosa]BAP58873.1 putative uncharacterized protein [Candidatus Tachikawaea gelatinosa]
MNKLAITQFFFWDNLLLIGSFFLIIEIFIGIGYFFLIGLSLLFTGFLSYFFNINFWLHQALIFSTLLIVISLGSLQWFNFIFCKKNDNSLNQKEHQLIGLQGILSETLVNKTGRMSFGDSSWRIKSETNLLKGTLIKVIKIEGITLIVKACN